MSPFSGAGAKVLSILWADDGAFEVIDFARGGWEVEALALSRPCATMHTRSAALQRAIGPWHTMYRLHAGPGLIRSPDSHKETGAAHPDPQIPWLGGMSALRTLRSRTVAGSHFRQLTHIRDLPVLIVDEPSGIADAEPAPEPLEVLLAALGSDLTIGIRAGAIARGITLSSLALDLEADIAVAPMDMVRPAPLGLEAVRVAVHIAADAPREALAALVVRATLRSSVANTLHDGTELNVALAEAHIG